MSPRVATSVVAVLLGLVLASAASAQIIYEPVQYQYSASGTTYYYGGSNPAVHDVALEPFSTSGTWGRVNGYAFVSGSISTHRAVVAEPERVFTDGWHRGFLNAHYAGFTANDARNEAYNSMPRYFVKRDLLNAAVRDADGSWLVRAQAQPIRIYKSNGTRLDVDRPATMPRPLMILPRDSFDKPSAPAAGKQVASAN